MPTPIPPRLRLGVAEPVDAFEAFARRGLLQPTFRWQDVWQDEHTRAFAVAGVMRMDVLQVLHDEVGRAVSEGVALEDFRARVRSQLVARGFWGNVKVTDPDTGEERTTRFDERRLQLVFNVNVRQSQAAGQWARIERLKQRYPYITYRTMRDERVRASHRPWDGVTLPVDHEWWNTHFPPNGWMCRCTAYGIDERGIERLRAAGAPIKTEPPRTDWISYVNRRSGEISPVPRGIDPGFAYNPGKGRDAAFFDAAVEKAARSSPLAGAVAVAQAQADYPAMVARKTAEFGRAVSALQASGRAQGRLHYVGVIDAGALRALQDAGMEPATAAIGVRDVDILHALRLAKGPVALPAALFGRLPELLARASALLLEIEVSPPVLLYVVDLVREDGSVAKLVLQLDASVRARVAQDVRATIAVNLVRTATVMDPNALLDSTRYRLLWGRVP